MTSELQLVASDSASEGGDSSELHRQRIHYMLLPLPSFSSFPSSKITTRHLTTSPFYNGTLTMSHWRKTSYELSIQSWRPRDLHRLADLKPMESADSAYVRKRFGVAKMLLVRSTAEIQRLSLSLLFVCKGRRF